jgi:hypothetical protein
MKRILMLAVLAVIVVYAVGRVRLGESGALTFVMSMESLMNGGKTEEVCAMFHDDLEVDITDHTAGESKNLTADKQDFCEQTRETAAGLRLLPHQMNVSFEDVSVKRDWLHPWTSEVSYTEDRTLSIPSIQQNFHTISEDTIVLVHTFSGVKLRKLRSEAFLAD